MTKSTVVASMTLVFLFCTPGKWAQAQTRTRRSFPIVLRINKNLHKIGILIDVSCIDYLCSYSTFKKKKWAEGSVEESFVNMISNTIEKWDLKTLQKMVNRKYPNRGVAENTCLIKAIRNIRKFGNAEHRKSWRVIAKVDMSPDESMIFVECCHEGHRLINQFCFVKLDGEWAWNDRASNTALGYINELIKDSLRYWKNYPTGAETYAKIVTSHTFSITGTTPGQDENPLLKNNSNEPASEILRAEKLDPRVQIRCDLVSCHHMLFGSKASVQPELKFLDDAYATLSTGDLAKFSQYHVPEERETIAKMTEKFPPVAASGMFVDILSPDRLVYAIIGRGSYRFVLSYVPTGRAQKYLCDMLKVKGGTFELFDSRHMSFFRQMVQLDPEFRRQVIVPIQELSKGDAKNEKLRP